MARAGDEALSRPLRHHGLSTLPGFFLKNRLVQPFIIDAVVADDPEVGFPRQDAAYQTLVDQPAHIRDGLHGVSLKVEVINPAHRFRVAVGNQNAFALIVVIAEGGSSSARPVTKFDALLHPAAGALVDILPFQLGEHREDADDRASEGGGRIKTLAHGDKRHVVGQKHVFDQIERVLLGAAQPVQLEYQNMGDPALLGVLDQLCHPGPFQ